MDTFHLHEVNARNIFRILNLTVVKEARYRFSSDFRYIALRLILIPLRKAVNFNQIRNKRLTPPSNYARTCHLHSFYSPGINNNYFLMNYLSVLNLSLRGFSFKCENKTLRWERIYIYIYMFTGDRKELRERRKKKKVSREAGRRKTKPPASNKKLLHGVFMTFPHHYSFKRLF